MKNVCVGVWGDGTIKHWNIGGAFVRCNLMSRLINIYKSYDNPPIEISVFDGIYNSAWTAGRQTMYLGMSDDNYLWWLDWYKDQKVGFNFVCSNTQSDVNEECGNKFLRAAHSSLNGIILTSDELRKHLRKKYPDYKLIYSLTDHPKEMTVDFYNQKLDEYDIVVLPTELNYNYDFINALSDSSRIEILVNESCYKNCQYRDVCRKVVEDKDTPLCFLHLPSLYKKSKEELLRVPTDAISSEHIKILESLGINHFKLSGRTELEMRFFYDLNHYVLEDLNIPVTVWDQEAKGLLGGDPIPQEKILEAQERYSTHRLSSYRE